MHRIINTGSFLQAYALKKMIEAQGHTVEFLDFYNPNLKDDLYTPPVNRFKRKYRLIKRKITEQTRDYLYAKRWDFFVYDLFEELGCSLKYNYDASQYDVVIVGSDEVFNCTQEDAFWFGDLIFFGKGLESKKVFSYAASFGYTTMERLDRFGLSYSVANYLKRMKDISVRDENSYKIVQKLTERCPEIHLDPVLVYDYSRFLPQKKKNEKYILVYSYDERIKEEKYINEIRQFAQSKRLTTISVNFFQSWCDKNIVVHPFEVLAYFRDADYVVTDTFHGTVMSIKYQKQFATIVRKSNSEKLTGLLNIFDLSNRIWKENSSLAQILDLEYNYQLIQNIIIDERKRSDEYLRKNLS